jgi:hypothetical protein
MDEVETAEEGDEISHLLRPPENMTQCSQHRHCESTSVGGWVTNLFLVFRP